MDTAPQHYVTQFSDMIHLKSRQVAARLRPYSYQKYPSPSYATDQGISRILKRYFDSKDGEFTELDNVIALMFEDKHGSTWVIAPPFHADSEYVRIRVMRQSMRKVEIDKHFDWRPDESIPEDYYAI